MKRKIVIAPLLLAAIGTVKGEIVINEFLSIEGFVDMAYTYFDGEVDVSGAFGFQETDNHFGIEEVEITFLFSFDPVTARIDFEYEENGEELEVEQAFVTYHFQDMLQGSTITAGRYASMLGFEAYERVGRYQYSTAYESVLLSDFVGKSLFDRLLTPSERDVFLNSEAFTFFESVLFPVGERYLQGVKYAYENDSTFFGVSIQDGTLNYENRLGGDDVGDDSSVDDGGYGFEIAYAHKFRSGLAYFLGGSYETGDGIHHVASPNTSSMIFGDTKTHVINTYATYELGAWLFAVELNYSETGMDDVFASGDDADIESFTSLFMTNYAYNNQASFTGRISLANLRADPRNADYNKAEAQILKYTVAHNYAFTENLLLVNELSYSDGEFDLSIDPNRHLEELFVAAQLLFIF